MTPPLALLTGPDQQGIAVITLNRPEKKNALSIALRDEMTALLGGLSADRSVKALVIMGSGGNFSAGLDLREFSLTEPGYADLTRRAAALARQASCAPREILTRNKEKFITRSAIAPGTPTLDL